MIVSPTKDGTLLRVRVAPKSSAERIGPPHGDELKVAVTAAPEKGKANDAVVKLLAKKLGVAKRDLEVVSGAADRRKTVLVRGLPPEAVRDRLGI